MTREQFEARRRVDVDFSDAYEDFDHYRRVQSQFPARTNAKCGERIGDAIEHITGTHTCTLTHGHTGTHYCRFCGEEWGGTND